MRFCTRLRGEPGPDGVLREAEILDVSLVDDGHMTGQDECGNWHIPGGVFGPVPEGAGES
ncbi:MAG TPA: hypothetical protein VNH17_02065 [Streptosporangiaceae bacterium]|nr:hypothetical protein [Streptosporangiaceae bacterium]